MWSAPSGKSIVLIGSETKEPPSISLLAITDSGRQLKYRLSLLENPRVFQTTVSLATSVCFLAFIQIWIEIQGHLRYHFILFY